VLPSDDEFDNPSDGYDESQPLPLTTPEYHLSDDEVEALEIEYSIRAPEDWVISGPLGAHGGGPGRRFINAQEAERWVREKYGDRVKYRIMEASNHHGNRWAWLIKGIKLERTDDQQG
jgi:hypothetical protein